MKPVLVNSTGTMRIYARRRPASGQGEVASGRPEAGLLGAFFSFPRTISTLPDCSQLAPTFTRVFSSIDFPLNDGEFRSASGINTGLGERFAAVFSGYILIDRPGSYSFSVESDDGFRLWIDDKALGEFLPARSFKSTEMTVALEAGAHPLRLEYYNNRKPGGLRLYYTPPGGSRQVIPPSVLRVAKPEPATD